MKLCLYLDDSLSSLKINNIDLFQGKDHLWTNEFIEFAPYDIRLEENHEIELILYNQGNIYGINGYIEIDGFRFYTNNTNLFGCKNCTGLYSGFTEKK